MELSELQQGLQNISPKKETLEMPPAEAPWLSMDNLMSSYGSWFDNDQGLGELLLGQLRARGVDTQSAVEAMLRQLLQDIVDDLGTLQQKLTGFISSIHKQMQDTQAVADSVQAALDMKDAKPSATEVPPPPMPTPDAGMTMPPEGAPMPPEGAPMPPEGAPMPPEGAPMPPEGAPMPPEGAPMPPEGAPMPPEGAPMPQGTPSDRRIKNVRRLQDTLSDMRMKRIKNTSASVASKLSKNILSACLGGF